jgi:hypothetical protein
MAEADVVVKDRKFKSLEHYSNQENNRYFLLPMRFARINPEKEVLVNEVGDHLVVPEGTFQKIVRVFH